VRNSTIHKVYNNGFQLLFTLHIINFQHVLELMAQLMSIARESLALVQMVLWTVQLHLDVFYVKLHQFLNTQVIQNLEDHIKLLVILPTLIKFQCQHHIQDKTPTISLKQPQHQTENQKKFQFLILQLQKLIQHSTDKEIIKN